MKFREFNQRVIEPAAQTTMIAGLVFLCQPWVEILHRYGLTIIILGLVTFMISTKIPPPREEAAEEEEERV